MKRHKYNAKKTIVDNIIFASKKEALRYMELKLMQKVGEISMLRLQEPLSVGILEGELICYNGQMRKKLFTYYADFTYIRKDGKFIYEDTKGMRLPVYKLKKKILEAVGIKITEV